MGKCKRMVWMFNFESFWIKAAYNCILSSQNWEMTVQHVSRNGMNFTQWMRIGGKEHLIKSEYYKPIKRDLNIP